MTKVDSSGDSNYKVTVDFERNGSLAYFEMPYGKGKYEKSLKKVSDFVLSRVRNSRKNFSRVRVVARTGVICKELYEAFSNVENTLAITQDEVDNIFKHMPEVLCKRTRKKIDSILCENCVECLSRFRCKIYKKMVSEADCIRCKFRYKACKQIVE